MPPKAGVKAAKGPPVPVEPDPAAALPSDLPAECPFEASWTAAVYIVQAADGVNAAAVKDACKQLQVLQQLAISDLAARLDPADPLVAEISAAEAAATGNNVAAGTDSGGMATHLAAKLLQQRFKRDQGLAWKFELVRRREALAKAAAEAKAAADAVQAAAQAEADAKKKLSSVKASLPQPEPIKTPQDAAAADADPDGTGLSGQQELQEVQYTQPELSPSQKRVLAEAEAEVAAASSKVVASTEAASTADAAVTAAQRAMDSSHNHYEGYWVEGLPATAVGIEAAIRAGVPVRAVAWLHPSPKAATAAGEVAAPSSNISLPDELLKLQSAVAAAPWDSPLATCMLVPVPIGDPDSPFTTVPQGSAIANPSWAAASSAAAAMRAAMVAAAAAEVKPPPPAPAAGGKPAAAGAKGGSTSGAPVSAKPGAAAAGTTAGAAAASAAPAGPEEVPGCKELARALLTVRDQARVYDQWRANLRVYLMPMQQQDGSSMSCYERLLSSVPPERENVPVVLHAMLEQVCHNCMGDPSTLDETLQETQQVLAMSEAEQALAAAFGQLVLDDSKLLDAPAAPVGCLTLLYEGDELASVACGLTTGYVHGKSSAHSNATRNSDGTGLLSDSTKGLTAADVDAVEQHMLQLLQFPGLDSAAEQQQEQEAGEDPAQLQRKLQHAQLKAHSDGMRVASLERYQLLQAAAAMLPAGVQSAHAEALLQRYHQEQMEPAVLRQVLLKASLEYPDMAASFWEGTGAELLAFYAGKDTDRLIKRSMPHVMTFQQYWEQLLARGCIQPQLSAQVYEMSAGAAQQGWQQQLLYTAAGGIATRGSEGQLAYHHNSNTVRLLPNDSDGGYHLVATLPGGVVASACCSGHKKLEPIKQPTDAAVVAEPVLAPPEVAEPAGAAAGLKKVGSKAVRPDSAGDKSSRKPSTAGSVAAGGSRPGTPGGARPGTPAAASAQPAVPAAVAPVQEAVSKPSPAAAASATVAAVRVCNPSGLLVELNTDGRVLMAPVAAQQAQTLHSSAVDVLGAPVAAGVLNASSVDGPFAWHALLPDGTLIKAGICAGNQTQDQATAADGLLSILHPDGSTSTQHQGAVQLADGSNLTARGWLHSNLDGSVTWVIDATALEDLKASAAKAAADAAAAAEAAVAAAAAEAAAAEAAAANKKGNKGADKRPLDKQKTLPGAARAAAGPDGATGPTGSTAGTGGSTADPAALQAMLQDLDHMQPQDKGSIRTVKLTDPDTQAVVVTREDHLMVVNYVGGNRLIQDAEGCRMSFLRDGWTFEASAMPVVRGNELGITVELCPGVTLAWSALTKCVTLQHASSDASLVATPCGRMAFSSQQPKEHLDLFTDLAMPQQQELPQQQQAGSAGPATVVTGPADVGSAVSAETDGQVPAEGAAAGPVTAADAAAPAGLLGLQDICGVQECWGVLGMDLCSGETVLHEEGGCRLHMGPGLEVVVWRNDHQPEPAPEEQQQQPEGDQPGTAAADSNASSAAAAPAASTSSTAVAQAPAVAAAATAAAAAVAVHDRSGNNDMYDDELDEEKAARLAAEAAAAAAAAAAEAEAQAAAEAAAAEAAAKQPPPPVAAGVKPRLFVVDHATGSGCEILDPDVVSWYMQKVAAVQECRHTQQAVPNAPEPGTVLHSFLTTYSTRTPMLQPLEIAEPAAAVTMQLDAARSLLSLRRTDVFVPAETVQQSQQGLKLPRVIAMNPGFAISGGSTSATPAASKDSLLATRVASTSEAATNSNLEQVVVVRELLELPTLSPDVQAEAQRVLGAFAEWKQAKESGIAERAPPEDPRNGQLQQEAAEVAALLQEAGFAALPSEGRLGAIQGQLLHEQATVAAAAEQARADAEAKAAADSAARRKPYKAWEKKVGPYDHCPQKPEPGKTLKYFDTQEGLSAAEADPLLQGTKITRHDLPPAKPVQAASAGVQQKPGVYLASNTTLAVEDTQGYAAGSAALGSPVYAQGAAGSPSSTARSPMGRRNPGSPATNRMGSPHAAPLMYAGKPAALGGPVGPAVMDAIAAATAAAAVHLKQQHQTAAEEQADAAVRAIMEGAGQTYSSSVGSEAYMGGLLGSGSPMLSASVKSHAFDVYGQPRVAQPQLPASHPKSQAPAELNSDYLAREAATMRTAKTSSASLIKCSGKAGRQLALTPGHIHFGNVTVGVPAHRTARLLNCSTDVVRFSIVRPELPLRVLYKPAPLPAGMEAVLTLELVAEHAGDYVGEVTVKSEINVLTLTVSAKVSPSAATQQVAGSSVDGATTDGDERAGEAAADASAAVAAKSRAGSAVARSLSKKQPTLGGVTETAAAE